MAAYSPTAEEADAFGQLFRHATKDSPGKALGGSEAVSFFVTSGVPVATLKQVWTLASSGQKELGQREFTTAMRLIALAQAGQAISESTLASTLGVKTKLPVFKGVQLVPFPQQHQPQQQQQAGPPLQVTPEARAQYEKLWLGLVDRNPVTGLLEGKDAAAFFAKSGQDREVLRQVWRMSDVTEDGMMDFTEFVIGMHLTMLAKKGYALPSALPHELLQSAKSVTSTFTNNNNVSALNASALNFSTLAASAVVDYSAMPPPAYVPPPPPAAAPALAPPPAASSSSYQSLVDDVRTGALATHMSRLGGGDGSSSSASLAGERDRLQVALQDSANKFERDCDKLRALDNDVSKLRGEVAQLHALLQAKRDAIGQQQDQIRDRLLEAQALTQQLASAVAEAAASAYN